MQDFSTWNVTPEGDVPAHALGQRSKLSGEPDALTIYHGARQLRPRWSLAEMRDLVLCGPCEKEIRDGHPT
jgi:hypothetical protein